MKRTPRRLPLPLTLAAVGVIASQFLPGKNVKAETNPPSPTPQKPEACEVFQASLPVPVMEHPQTHLAPVPDFCGDVVGKPPTPVDAGTPLPDGGQSVEVGRPVDVGIDVPDLMVEDPKKGIAAIKAAEHNEALMREVKYLLPGQVTAIAEMHTAGSLYSTSLLGLPPEPSHGAEKTWEFFKQGLPANILKHIDHVVIVAGDNRYNIYDRTTGQWATAATESEKSAIIRSILSGTYDDWVSEETIYKWGPKVKYLPSLPSYIIDTMYIDPSPSWIDYKAEGFRLTMPPLDIILRLDNGQIVSYRTTPIFYMSNGLWYDTKDLAASSRVGYPNVWVRYDFDVSDKE